MMDVILLERVEHLGHMGEVVRVRPGYARNFLLPQRKALRATESNKKLFEAQRAQIEADNAKRKAAAADAGAKLDGQSVVLIRQAGDAGQLYGSVSARDLADSLVEQGFAVSRNQIVLEKPIKALGVSRVRVALHPEVSVFIDVNIARSKDEADLQAKGIDVIAQAAQEEAAERAAMAAERSASFRAQQGDGDGDGLDQPGDDAENN
jgi:large subunit ribosomal protein L9